METGIQALISAVQDNHLKQIGEKIINKERISFDEGVALFEKGSLSYVGALANWVREQKHGNKTYFNRATLNQTCFDRTLNDRGRSTN